MLKFIIRLDDACPYMDKKNWDRIENILDSFNIKPIVGIIPDCKDKKFLEYPIIEDFWTKDAIRWQKKGWIIAQHGLNHSIDEKIRTEYIGKSYDEQFKNICEGNKILKGHNINPICFFAPAHTFDDNTIKACKNSSFFKFISDGVSFYPYEKNGITFIPNVFDTPHHLFPFGVYTFIYHPNEMKENDFTYLTNFLTKYNKHFVDDYEELLSKYKNRNKNIFDLLLYFSISLFRKVKGTKR